MRMLAWVRRNWSLLVSILLISSLAYAATPSTPVDITNVPLFTAGNPGVVSGTVTASAGTFNNNADNVATSATNGQAAAWNYVWDGSAWDRLYGDSTNGAFVNVKTSVLPTGAATQATLASILVQLAFGQGTMAASIPVTLASNQSALPVTVAAAPLQPIGITPTDRTLISATGSSQTLMPENAARHSLIVQNIGNANCGVNPTGGTAAIGGAGTLTLAPYGSYQPRIPTLTAVTVICTAGQPFYAEEN